MQDFNFEDAQAEYEFELAQQEAWLLGPDASLFATCPPEPEAE